MQSPSQHLIDEALSDVDLAARIAAGSEEAFTVLMRRHNQRLFRAARSILHDDAEAEDALQDAYLLAYRQMGSFRGDAKLSTWLTRIVVNTCLARVRRSSRRAKVIPLHGAPLDEPDYEEADMNAPPPDQLAMRAQARALLEASIDALPESFRTVFVMRAVEEMSGEEVALCLGIPEATVRSRFFRARGMLRTALLQHMDVAFDDAFSFDGARCDRIVARVLARLARPPSDGF